MSKRIYLRALEMGDLNRLHQWHNDSELYATLISPFRPVSTQTVSEWLEKRTRFSEKEINFAICISETSEHIGNIYMRDIDYVNRNAFLGAFISCPEQRSKGYASEALLQVIGYAFDILGLIRLYMYVLANNIAAVKHLEKCGFSVEGKMRRHAFKNGTFNDVLVLGLCKEIERTEEGQHVKD